MIPADPVAVIVEVRANFAILVLSPPATDHTTRQPRLVRIHIAHWGRAHFMSFVPQDSEDLAEWEDRWVLLVLELPGRTVDDILVASKVVDFRGLLVFSRFMFCNSMASPCSSL